MDFREFLTESNENDVRETLKKIPKTHSELVKGYKYVFQAGNTMIGDKNHVGLIDTEKKRITIAAPWRYGREFCLLHEIGHMVWANFVNEKQRQKWSDIVKETKNKMKESDEELYCMAYAATYSSNPPEIHNHKKWINFVKNVSK